MGEESGVYHNKEETMETDLLTGDETPEPAPEEPKPEEE